LFHLQSIFRAECSRRVSELDGRRHAPARSTFTVWSDRGVRAAQQGWSRGADLTAPSSYHLPSSRSVSCRPTPIRPPTSLPSATARWRPLINGLRQTNGFVDPRRSARDKAIGTDAFCWSKIITATQRADRSNNNYYYVNSMLEYCCKAIIENTAAALCAISAIVWGSTVVNCFLSSPSCAAPVFMFADKS